tara:strand:+ start:72 stop:824 length:753 start_codon:yes stop_codon:yes gene_type:complete
MDFRPNEAALKAAQFDKSALPVAQPVVSATHVQPAEGPAVAVQAVAVPMGGDGRQGPAGSWHDGLCDCFNDCGTCCCATCCPLIMIAQLRQLVLGGSCVSTAIFLFVTIYGGGTMRVMGSLIANAGAHPESHHHELRHGQDSNDYDDSDAVPEITGAIAFAMVVSCVGGMMQLLGGVLALIWTVSGRTAMRVKEGLRPDTCGEAEDCLLGLCCQCCTISQMMRHVLGRWGTRGGAPYELCSPTGSVSVAV